MTSLKVSCFDVDYESNPKLAKACPLNHVAVTCVGRLHVLEGRQAAFLLSLCSFGQDSDRYALARINYAGPSQGRVDFQSQIKKCTGTLLDSESSGCQLDAFLTENRVCAMNLLSDYWRNFGGNWILGVNCSAIDVFVSNCALAENGVLRPSEVRDKLVAVSDIAVVTFDDDIADILTARYNAETMRKKLISLAEQYDVAIEWT